MNAKKNYTSIRLRKGRYAGKLMITCDRRKSWVYVCRSCKQYRFYPSEDKPIKCGNCSSEDIEVARPMMLKKEKG